MIRSIITSARKRRSNGVWHTAAVTRRLVGAGVTSTIGNAYAIAANIVNNNTFGGTFFIRTSVCIGDNSLGKRLIAWHTTIVCGVIVVVPVCARVVCGRRRGVGRTGIVRPSVWGANGGCAHQVGLTSGVVLLLLVVMVVLGRVVEHRVRVRGGAEEDGGRKQEWGGGTLRGAGGTRRKVAPTVTALSAARSRRIVTVVVSVGAL